MDQAQTLTQAERLKMLIAANQAFAKVESVEQLLPLLIDLAAEVTCAEASSILLYNPDTHTLDFFSTLNEPLGGKVNVLKEKISLNLGEGIAGTVAQTRQSLNVPDVSKDPRFFKKADESTGFITRAILCLPIVHNEELLGVVEVLNPKHKKSFDADDQEILACFADLAGVAIIRSKLLEIRIRQEKFQAQLTAASQIQKHFLPSLPDLGPGCGVWAMTKPAMSVGGDFYDFIHLGDGSWIIYVVDVAGKGLSASLVMSALWSNMRTAAVLVPDPLPEKIMRIANISVYEALDMEIFATLLLGRYWPETGKLQLACAGHLPPLWVGPEGMLDFPELKGLPLGIDPSYEYASKEIVVSPGEGILFISDGVSEARNNRGEFWGDQKTVDYLLNNPGPPWGPGLAGAISAWRRGAMQNDDLTIVELWRYKDLETCS